MYCIKMMAEGEGGWNVKQNSYGESWQLSSFLILLKLRQIFFFHLDWLEA